MIRFVRLTRNGNAVAFCVPRPLLTELGWTRGDVLVCGPRDGALIVRRQDESRLLEPPPPVRKARVRSKGR